MRYFTSALVTLSTSLSQAARLRAETRGSHWREDFPLRDDEEWAGHIDLRLVEDELELEFVPSPATDLQKEPT